MDTNQHQSQYLSQHNQVNTVSIYCIFLCKFSIVTQISIVFIRYNQVSLNIINIWIGKNNKRGEKGLFDLIWNGKNKQME